MFPSRNLRAKTELPIGTKSKFTTPPKGRSPELKFNVKIGPGLIEPLTHPAESNSKLLSRACPGPRVHRIPTGKKALLKMSSQ